MKTITAAEGISPEYLSDESRFTGSADAISFPEDVPELVELVGRLARSATPFTVQGARTGITGGSVGEGGHIVNLSKMNRISALDRDERTGGFTLTVGPGLTLADLRRHLERKDFGDELRDDDSRRAFERFRAAGRLFFPADPTETTATLGGMAACNASGARSYRYGAMRDHVTALGLLFPTGAPLFLPRGRDRARGREFTLALDNGLTLSGRLPGYDFRNVKNAAGYFVRENMDLLDLFIGQEGTLAVIGRLCLRLLPAPEHALGVLFFFRGEWDALAFVSGLRAGDEAGGGVRPCAIEYFDRGALDLVRSLEDERIRKPDPLHAAAVYVEAEGGEEEALFGYFSHLSDLMESLGEDGDANWAGDDEREREALRAFRHAVPEAVNAAVALAKRTAPGIRKLATDFAVPDGRLEELYALYRTTLDPSGLRYVMFGHIGDNHLHVNVLPRTEAEYATGQRLFRGIAESVVGMGGTVSAEHGIGKLKRDYLVLMYGEERIEEMKRLKRLFDPGYLLNRGNLFTLP